MTPATLRPRSGWSAYARISRTNGQWTITDLNSTNYTRVDGNKLDPSLPAPIKDGARIQFGRIATTFRE